jgi:hypothetical protein
MRQLDRIDFIAPLRSGRPARRAPVLLGVVCGLAAATLLPGSAGGTVWSAAPKEAEVAREAMPAARPSAAPPQTPARDPRGAAPRRRA